MSTRAELQDQVATTVERARAIITAVADGEYAATAVYEADVNQWRRDVAALVADLEVEFGISALATVQALRSLGARLLDLRSRISDGTITVTTVVDRPLSLIELAMEWYGDPSRWRELRAMNPRIRHPGFVVPGTGVQRHAQ